ncbi:MAG: hypothetical protein HY778_13075 [Betaproteobacteria bacterium]|nr:hypothetical protein [Betaproteobacteria bacterium]
MKRFILLLVLALFGHGLAAQELEVLRLRHRSAEQVLPALRPLVESGGALTGQNDALFLRASSANRAQIRRAVAELDRPLRRLVISLRLDNELSGASDGTRAWSTRGRADDRVALQVQAVEGGAALIHVGRSLPVPLRQVGFGPGGVGVSESVVFRDLGSGFLAVPQLAGERVTLEISPEHTTASGAVPGAARGMRLSTTVSGRLGEWIALGGAGQESARERASAREYSTRSGAEPRQVWLRVDELE